MGELKTTFAGKALLHRTLWHIVKRHLPDPTLDAHPADDDRFDDLVAMVFAFHALEAYINYVGPLIAPDLWDPERNAFAESGIRGKLAAIIERTGLKLDLAKRPLRTVMALRELRDSLSQADLGEGSVCGIRDASGLLGVQHAIFSGAVNSDSAHEAKEDVADFGHRIHEAVRKIMPASWVGGDPFEGVTEYAEGGVTWI